MTDRKIIALTAAAAAAGIITPIGWAAFLGLQTYYWTDTYLKSREDEFNEPKATPYIPDED